MLDYYSEMADSGAGMVVVENVPVEPCGPGNPRTLLISEVSARARRPK
jgi:2,4-dienoyl-CoA reductase-like NADH-dependent reductase (Old Yellow Enzyme family)